MKPYWIGIVILALALCACAQDRSLAGEWSGQVKIDNQETDDVSKEIAKTLGDTMSLNLDLKNDGSYIEQVLFFTIVGHWEIKQKQLLLHPKTLDKTPIDQVKDPDIKSELLQPKTFKIDQNSGTFSRTSPSGDYQEVYARSQSKN